ncbi:hypothetical protein ASZ90_006913 [hydrocarbon metagenome]|uniref:Uncharacterized protein n=1 Tax=hydrocarbon metagenome TaxID=938273 RepID=A0A0W8FR59_9ZZZZ
MLSEKWLYNFLLAEITKYCKRYQMIIGFYDWTILQGTSKRAS